VTKIDTHFQPVGSNLSCEYEHPEGITLTLRDAYSLNIEIE